MNVIGIDATNIRVRGGIVHLQQLLKHADPERDGFSSIVICFCISSLTCSGEL